MNWTQQTPTQEGYYWFYCKDPEVCYPEVQFVHLELHEDGSSWYAEHIGDERSISSWQIKDEKPYWIGPLVIVPPAPPEETQK